MRAARDAGFCKSLSVRPTAGYILLASGRYYVYCAETGVQKEKRGIKVDKHPIESLMGTSMESIREMVDVNTVVEETKSIVLRSFSY